VTVPYATPRHVYDLGLTAQAFVVRPRPLASRAGDFLDYATGTFWMLGHGLDATDIVWLVLVAGSGGTLPGGALATISYSPIVVDGRRFRLSLTEGGSAVTFTNAGTSESNGVTAWGILADPERRLMACILAESADVDQCLIAHSTPLLVDPDTGLYPQKVVDIVARGAARRAIAGALFDNAASKIPTERLDATKADDDAQKERWRSGVPLYPQPLDQTDTIADNAARANNGAWPQAQGRYPIDWQRGSL
jgi:hypothetical protein